MHYSQVEFKAKMLTILKRLVYIATPVLFFSGCEAQFYELVVQFSIYSFNVICKVVRN